MVTRVWALPDLRCEMNIQRLNGRPIDSKVRPVQVQAIGREQLQFVSDLKLPAQELLILGFNVRFREKAAFGEGRITKVGEAPFGGGYHYTVALTIRSVLDTKWTELLSVTASAHQEQHDKIEKLYQRWQQMDFGFGRDPVQVDARR